MYIYFATFKMQYFSITYYVFESRNLYYNSSGIISPYQNNMTHLKYEQEKQCGCNLLLCLHITEELLVFCINIILYFAIELSYFITIVILCIHLCL